MKTILTLALALVALSAHAEEPSLSKQITAACKANPEHKECVKIADKRAQARAKREAQQREVLASIKGA